MGGISVQPPIRFNVRETTADLAKYLDNWFDILIVRTPELSTLHELASSAAALVVMRERDQIILAKRWATSPMSEAGADRSTV